MTSWDAECHQRNVAAGLRGPRRGGGGGGGENQVKLRRRLSYLLSLPLPSPFLIVMLRDASLALSRPASLLTLSSPGHVLLGVNPSDSPGRDINDPDGRISVCCFGSVRVEDKVWGGGGILQRKACAHEEAVVMTHL